MKKIVVALTIFFAVAFGLMHATGENVSVRLLSREFQRGVHTIDGPEKIAAHVRTADFINGFMGITDRLYTDFMLEYYRQARLTGIIVGNEFIGAVEVLMRRAKEASESNSYYLESSISDINNRLDAFLIAKPGNLETQQEIKLGELPSQAGPIVVHYENYEPEILFNELERLVDQDMASVHNFIQKIYLLGWQKARLSLQKLKQQFRDEFLHCTLLKTFLRETSKINAESKRIQKDVTAESWNKYKELSDRVAFIARNVTLTPKFCETDSSH